MPSIKTRRLRRATTKKQNYLDAFGSRIKKKDKTTPTYAQWAAASPSEQGLMKAGVSGKRLRRTGVKAPGSYTR